MSARLPMLSRIEFLREDVPGGEERFEERLMDVLAQAGDLAGRGHLDAERRVGALRRENENCGALTPT